MINILHYVTINILICYIHSISIIWILLKMYEIFDIFRYLFIPNYWRLT